MSPLALRKRLLIAESELNRAQLVDEVAELAGRLGAITDSAVSYGTMASSVAGLLSGLLSGQPTKPTIQRNWLQQALSGASLLSSLWQTFRSR